MIFNSGEKSLSFEYLYTVEDYLTFKIIVRSGEYSGTSNFCISKDQRISAIRSFSDMHDKLVGSCTLKDYDSDAYITFEMSKLGHMNVFGQIGGSHADHFMKFKYVIDQTILQSLIQMLQNIY